MCCYKNKSNESQYKQEDRQIYTKYIIIEYMVIEVLWIFVSTGDSNLSGVDYRRKQFKF